MEDKDGSSNGASASSKKGGNKKKRSWYKGAKSRSTGEETVVKEDELEGLMPELSGYYFELGPH